MNDLSEKINLLKWYKAMGVDYYLSKPEENITESGDGKGKPKKDGPAVARALADGASNLTELEAALRGFDYCALKSIAKNTVFAEGNPEGGLMLIGEAPGASEDERGVPFCGESGLLLDEALKSIGYSRKKNAYITNGVFWRPPANRTPTHEEIELCRPFVEKHIALVSPKLIVLVGNTAVVSVLDRKEGITKIKQNFFSYSNKYLKKPIPVTAIFHPAYLLRRASEKKATWFDLIKIKKFLEKSEK